MENVHPLRLRLLLEIERTGSISAAAARCSISQPSASMHLRILETAIAQRLVIRNKRGSSLTAAGKVVASHAAQILSTMDHMVRALDGDEGGELTLVASLAPSVLLIPRVLRQFSNHYPGLSVKLRTLPSQTVVQEIARGEADIGIAGDVPTAEGVIRKKIIVDEVVGIAAVGFLTSDSGHATCRELARYNLLVGAQESSTRITMDRYLAGAGYRPARIWEFDCHEAIKRAVADGLGVSFASRLLVQEELERGDLAAFRVSGMEPMARPIHVIHSAIREPTPQSIELMTLLSTTPWRASRNDSPGNGQARRPPLEVDQGRAHPARAAISSSYDALDQYREVWATTDRIS